MSPASAVEVQSPNLSSVPSLQNPRDDAYKEETVMEFPNFSNPSGVLNNSSGGVLPSESGFRINFRARPRMVKVRKHGRPRGVSVSGEFGSGFNPFQFCNESSSFDVDKCELKINDTSFVFGAFTSASSSGICSVLNCTQERVFELNGDALSNSVESGLVFDDVKEKNLNENEGESVIRVDRGKHESSSFENGLEVDKCEFKNDNTFVFGASSSSSCCGNDSVLNCSVGLNLECQERVFDSTVEALSSNSGFTFKNVQEKNLNENEEKPVPGVDREEKDSLNFVFGANEMDELQIELKTVISEENVKVSNVGFVFGANNKSDLEKTQPEESRLDSGLRKASVETEVEFGKDNFAGFGTIADERYAGSHLNEGVYSDIAAKPDSDNSCCADTGISNSSFVFGSSWVDLANIESGGDLKDLISDESDKMKLEDQINIGVKGSEKTSGTDCRIEDTDKISCAFGCGSEKYSSSEKFTAPDKAEAENGSVDSNNDCNSVFESLKTNKMLATDPEVNLSDEMKKLNIDVSEKVDSADNKMSPLNDHFFFVFRSNEEDASPSGTFGSDTQGNMGVFASASEGLRVPVTEFKMPNWDACSLKESLFQELNRVQNFSAKDRLKKDKKSKKMRGKLKQFYQPEQHQEQRCQQHLENGGGEEAPNSSGCYSPMDFSPYEDTTAEIFSREPPMTSNDSLTPDNILKFSSLPSKLAGHLRKGQILDLDKGYEMTPECSAGDSPTKVFGFELPRFDCDTELVFSGIGASINSIEDAPALNAEKSHRKEFSFELGFEDIDRSKFSFSASCSTPKTVSKPKRISAAKCVHRKKYGRKVAKQPVVTHQNVKDQGGDPCTSLRKHENNVEPIEQLKQGSTSAASAIQEACETWRVRGNHAYKNGDLSKAEECYTHGINSVPSDETTGPCLKPLVICYSNRAATRMSLGNMREALKDCAMAASLDPRFLKAQMRAANCHLSLGEVEKAQNYFNKCLESGASVCLDRRITIEASDGLQKCQKVAECMNQSAELFNQRKSTAAVSALDIIAEVFSICPYSERLLEMKAEFMLMLQRYEEAIQLCEKTLPAAEKNAALLGTDEKFVIQDGFETENHSIARLWRWHLMSKSYFYLGKLEAALGLLEKLELMGPMSDKCASQILESSISLAVTIRVLMHHKREGNAAFRSGKYTEALEHYNAAISSNIVSRPFAAICFCNRAAAHQALSQISDAIADCSLAIALDRNYSKAISRRASMYELIRDYGQAASDLQGLISILECDGKLSKSGTPGRSGSSTKELRQARRRLSLMEEEAKKGIPLDLYLILGVKKSDTAADIKKAYRKAALRHHPDKAGQCIARSESGDEGRLWKDIVQEVHVYADRLFKMIGEAYAVLSDSTKRSEYDLDEEVRKASKEYSGNHPSRRPSDGHSYSYQRSDHPRNWQDTWRTHGHSRSRW